MNVRDHDSGNTLHHPVQHGEEDGIDYGAERRHYLVGFLLALALTVVPFAVVAVGVASRTLVLALIATFALIQLVVQFRYFLHIDLSRQKREDLQLILFTTLLLSIMAGGTIWIMANLSARMH